MSVEENRAIARRYVEECWNKKNMAILDELFTSDCPHHMNGPVNFKGPDGFKASFNNWFKGFPDLEVTIEDQVTEGDMSVIRGKVIGTHQGDLQFGGMPAAIAPTGKQLEFEGITMCRMANGKIVELWSIANFTWLQELAQS